MTCILTVLLLLLVVAGRLIGFLPPAAFQGLSDFILLTGTPVFAIILAGMSLRDGLTQRTLLYPLLGPVPRGVIALVRTFATAALLFVLATLTLIGVKALAGLPWDTLPREILSLLFGSLAYVSLFGLIHLVNSKGLVLSLCLFLILDVPVGSLPFTVRNISPSFHMRLIADKVDTFSLPIAVDIADSSRLISILVLCGLTAATAALTAYLFSRRNLVNLC